jgi:hypothetical protein
MAMRYGLAALAFTTTITLLVSTFAPFYSIDDETLCQNAVLS